MKPTVDTPASARSARRPSATLTTFALVIGLLGLAACGSEQPELGATPEEVTGDPDAYYGETVTMTGVIGEVLGPRTFTLGGDGGSALLVVSRDSVPIVPGRTATEPLVARDTVQVTGVIEQVAREDLVSAYGIALEESIAARYEGGPVLIAVSSANQTEPIVVTAPAPQEDETEEESSRLDGGEITPPEVGPGE